jgi:YVTN family beta-propeller protein
VTNEYGNTVSVINTTSNKVTATVPVGHDPTGVAVTPDGSKIYVTNYGGNTVSVVNTISNRVEATVMSEIIHLELQLILMEQRHM